MDFAQPLDDHDVGKNGLLIAIKCLYKSFSYGAAIVLSIFNATVYDVGCGDGRVLIQMASRSVPFITDSGGTASYCCNDETNNNSTTSSSSQQSSPTNHYCKQFIGIEISPERVEEARSNIRHAKDMNQIPSHVSIEIICANALDTDVIDYSRATVIFLYLVPRGLRLIKPIVWPKEDEPDSSKDDDDDSQTSVPSELRECQTSNKKCRRVITYMSPFEDEEYVRKELCHVDHQVGAAWPVYLYHIKK